MPDAKGRYDAKEQRRYEFPPCPECGGPTIGQWVDASDMSDPPGSNVKIPGSYACANPSAHA